MTLKQLLIFLSIATTTSWLVWLFVVFTIDPATSSLFGFFLFYLSLFFALYGSFFLLTFAWRRLFTKFVFEYTIVGTSFRQSFFFAVLIILMLMLQSRDFLTWWNTGLLIIALTLIEFFILSARQRRV
ncbi:MAG: hypothetical protein KBB55_03065 [Candidatus Buchananbacteria bacterium]|nr:hypothetical protein [Candidatus Buchananbacteria bacterium]